MNAIGQGGNRELHMLSGSGMAGLQVPAFTASARSRCRARWDPPLLSCVRPWPAPGAGAAGPRRAGPGPPRA